jgi:hypothetical protein
LLRQDIRSLFDPQIELILQHITDQLDWLKTNGHPQQVVSFVLDEGGQVADWSSSNTWYCRAG